VLPDGSGPPNGCPGSLNYGIMVDIKYQVLDQAGQPIRSATMTPYETVTFFTGGQGQGNIGPVPGYPTSSLTTAADGTFHDVPFGTCSVTPILAPGENATQDINLVMPGGASYPVRAQYFTVTAPTFGHGTITNNVVSPGWGPDISATR